MADTLRVRCIFPDGWLETRLELPHDTPLDEVKRRALEGILKTREFGPDEYYIEFREGEVSNESMTLRELGVADGSVVSIRRYDLHHPPPYRG